MKKYTLKDKFLFGILFTTLGLLALQVPFSQLIGSQVKFTLFDFFAPTAGAFLGPINGMLSVFAIQVANLLFHGAKIPDLGGIIRLFPTLFAVFYFSKKRTVNLAIPVLAIITFNLHPVGRSAWQYSLLWLIPMVTHLLRQDNPGGKRGLLALGSLYIRSLGATFTAHAVGGAAWVWAFGLSRQIWLGLIPTVLMERAVFALGISILYVVFTNVLNFAKQKKFLPSSLRLEKRYLY